MKQSLLFAGLFWATAVAGQTPAPNLVEQLMQAQPAQFGAILANPAKYEVQVLYTQIDRDARNRPQFTSHAYRVDAKQYYYPASTVKLPGAILALEKINELKIKGLTKYSPLQIDSAAVGQMAVTRDTTAEDGQPSLAHYIKKILLVSDNDAYNRCYEFLGQQALNERLYAKGFRDLRLVHRLSVGDNEATAKVTNPFTFYAPGTQRVVYQQPLLTNQRPFPHRLDSASLRRGVGYLSFRNSSEGELVNQPMDFNKSNYISIANLQGILKTLLFPEAVPKAQRFSLTPDDYQFMYRYMSMYPGESRYPAYQDTCCNYDGYCKFLLYGDTKEPIPKNIRIFNKVGNAYGYLIDNAYVVDFDRGIEFLLTAVIYVNEDGIFNDNQYEYDEIGYPFLANLGRAVYAYELTRPRARRPDLRKFKLNY
ncbi:MAG: class A beta-lactamase-related serine hydrolase [Bernardetiaceae bacterium]|jgi:hypothetical protein|nr:class A beta-lactamase-related serine hydrolase [Bernardetiaceae bacterium]